jgi:AcrR family transcriptional regulator
MSGNSPPKSQPKADRRVRRTRNALGDALVELMQEKPFEAISVDDVLKRANVARSTFYAHYLHKDDLFLSDAEEFFESIATFIARSGEQSRRVAPVRELFAHVADAQDFYAALVASGKYQDLMQMGRGVFARAIEQRLAQLGAHADAPQSTRAAIADGLAGALFSMLERWMQRNRLETPEAMDDAFHRLVWPAR